MLVGKEKQVKDNNQQAIDRYNAGVRQRREQVIDEIIKLQPTADRDHLNDLGKEHGNNKLYDIRDAIQMLKNNGVI